MNAAPDDEEELYNRIKELQFTLFEITQLLEQRKKNRLAKNGVRDKSKNKTELSGDRKNEKLEKEKIPPEVKSQNSSPASTSSSSSRQKSRSNLRCYETKTESGSDWSRETLKLMASNIVQGKAPSSESRSRKQNQRSINREAVETKAQKNPVWGISNLKIFAPEVAIRKAPEVAMKNAPAEQDSNALRIFIEHLSPKTDAKSLKNYFEKFGEIVDAFVPKNRDSGENRGFAYVTFSHIFGVSPLDVASHVIDGRRVDLDHVRDRKQSNVETDSLLVSGQLMDVSNEALKSHFGKYGTIRGIKRQQIKGKFSRAAVIHYQKGINSVKLAMKDPTSKVDGVYVDVRPARDF